MLGSFLLTLREGFEATLLVAIVLAYLAKVGHGGEARKVWYGVAAAVLLSLGVAGALFAVDAELEGAAEAVFEGAAMWLAVVFLTYMILWMGRQARSVSRGIREDLDRALKKGGVIALASLSFVMVFREGLETALFMFGVTQVASPAAVAVGGALGLAAAVGLGFAVYAGGRRIDLGKFFKVTGVLLLVVAAGLLAHGVAEFEEAGLLPESLQPLWNLSGVSLLSEESVVGQFLGTFFGWNPAPDLLEFGVWAVYLLVIGYAFLRPAPAHGARVSTG